jgi:hypothetical protein
MTLFVLCLGILPASANSPTFPNIIDLPTGFRPEGIALGRQTTFFTGSLENGAIYRGDLLTGKGDIFIPGEAGKVSVGMAYDNRSDALFVAGGITGSARVFNASTGVLMESYQLAAAGNFINDVVITQDAAYFTNSNQALLYRLPLEANGDPPGAGDVEILTLHNEWQQVPGFNANGIEASPDGRWLVVVNSTRGELYRVDAASGAAVLINLGGESVSMGDGLRFRGSLLYVMRNRANELVAIDLSDDMTSGKVVNKLTNYPGFNVPTTLAAFGDVLYTVNAKFTSPDPLTLPFEVVRISLKD